MQKFIEFVVKMLVQIAVLAFVALIVWILIPEEVLKLTYWNIVMFVLVIENVAQYVKFTLTK